MLATALAVGCGSAVGPEEAGGGDATTLDSGITYCALSTPAGPDGSITSPTPIGAAGSGPTYSGSAFQCVLGSAAGALAPMPGVDPASDLQCRATSPTELSLVFLRFALARTYPTYRAGDTLSEPSDYRVMIYNTQYYGHQVVEPGGYVPGNLTLTFGAVTAAGTTLTMNGTLCDGTDNPTRFNRVPASAP